MSRRNHATIFSLVVKVWRSGFEAKGSEFGVLRSFKLWSEEVTSTCIHAYSHGACLNAATCLCAAQNITQSRQLVRTFLAVLWTDESLHQPIYMIFCCLSGVLPGSCRVPFL